ncbi:hypothetical protein LR48_Vigan08g078000 [Vigna angularis]|uniref:Uncharacterized protein n=1 Tax=Phaseolus angularis TaxID=3914 RepID=A0A0L9V4S0_PHAAN|nr:hypothetical protein LR48_Vigan08g078000 [Vigna angularis]
MELSEREGRGYVDDATEALSSSAQRAEDTARVSPIEVNDSSEEVTEEEIVVEIEIDTTREWNGRCVPLVVAPGYGWAPHEVRLYAPSFVTGLSLEELVGRVYILASETDANNIKLIVCKLNEQACHGREQFSSDFFYVYSTLFRDLGVRLPFSDFQIVVLHALNVAPTQLHPNGRASFQRLCVVMDKGTTSAFAMMMAQRKEELKKMGEGTSSAFTCPKVPKSLPSSWSVLAAL